jgi:hypothetical protein
MREIYQAHFKEKVGKRKKVKEVGREEGRKRGREEGNLFVSFPNLAFGTLIAPSPGCLLKCTSLGPISDLVPPSSEGSRLGICISIHSLQRETRWPVKQTQLSCSPSYSRSFSCPLRKM